MVSGASTTILTSMGVRDVVGMVHGDWYPMLACPYPDLVKNSVFGHEGAHLCRQKFDPEVLNHREMQPVCKQHHNLNINGDMEQFIFLIRKTGLKLHLTGCDL